MNVNRSILNALRRDRRANFALRLENQRKAWKKGKKVMLTIKNPVDTETNKRFIRVLASTYWGDPREASKNAVIRDESV